MILHRTEDEVRRFNWFKWLTLLVLFIIFIILLLRGNPAGNTAVSDTPTGDTTAQVESSDVDLSAPTLNAPEGDLTSGAVTLSGTGEPGSDVAVLIDGEVVGTATVGDDGTWALDTDLEAGSYTFAARTLNADGSIAAEADGIELSVGDALMVPTVDLPDAALTAGAVTLTGTGTPGSEVDVMVDGVSVGRTTVGDDGTWSLDTELTDGAFDLTVQASNGGETAVSDAIDLSVNPRFTAPTITLPDGDLTAGTVSLNGTGTPGSTVDVVVDGEVVGTADVGDDGTWTYDLDLPEGGDFELSARTLDASGAVAAESDPTSLNLALPEITLPTFDLPDIGFPTGPFALTGTGTPGDTIDIVVDGEVVGTTVVGEDGTWSFDLDLPDGEYALSARVLDADGNPVGTTDPTVLTISNLDLPTPTVELPDGGFTPGTFTLNGSGAPGSEVEIVVDGEVVGTTTVGDDGTWSFDLELPEGEYELVVNGLDDNGQVITSSDSALISLNPTGEVAPLAISEPSDGATLQSGELTLSGTGEPGSEIEILDNGVVIGTAVVNDGGTWSYSFTPEPGNHEYGVRAAGAEEPAASVMTTIEAPVTDTSAVGICDNPTPGTDLGSTYIVGECEWLIRIANRLGVDYDAVVALNPQIENPNIIYVGQVINLPPR